MFRVKNGTSDVLYTLYMSNNLFFPLIAAVLQGKQNGIVYVDDPKYPSQAYVEHSFGFAQIFGETVQKFEIDLENYLLISKQFTPSKIRLYAPYVPSFLTLQRKEAICSYRQRFTISIKTTQFVNQIDCSLEKDVELRIVDENNISIVDRKFGVVNRFWKNPDDFAKNSNGVLVFFRDEPASICYAAAEANNFVEIDVLTLPEYRNLGLAKLAVKLFLYKCNELSLYPLWDCFTNNSGSTALCKTVGFLPLNSPYQFYTINK